MKKKKLFLHCTSTTLKSTSLKAIAQGLSTIVGKKVLRTIKHVPTRRYFKYGHGVDKISQYKFFEKEEIPALEYTTDSDVADGWLLHNHTVFGRKYLNSSCGKGIVIITSTENIPELPVYTKYKKKKREFRVHCFADQVVSVTEKKRKKGFEGERDTKIRNLANGYVFCQTVENEPEGLRELALRAARVSPSHFRGVDIGYNEQKQELFVIEVNSAPGIMGANVDKYLQVIKTCLN